ncbi:fungal hydrophobin-domain-containing protein [Collybia nuda]|uniref:Hydrophobin n=1 Tax=Collybia nuda TaxID=64659 RepID=A0A9P6CH44_9AGAR|nr:fungal hydrophobin-domain-containing protein [Collybia nuda]
MFSKVAILATVSLALSVAAAPGGGSDYKCNTGDIQCCNEVHQTGSARATQLHALVGVVVQDVAGMAGENCSPITAVGLGNGASCKQEPICCENNQMNGLIVVGCSPININL